MVPKVCPETSVTNCQSTLKSEVLRVNCNCHFIKTHRQLKEGNIWCKVCEVWGRVVGNVEMMCGAELVEFWRECAG